MVLRLLLPGAVEEAGPTGGAAREVDVQTDRLADANDSGTRPQVEMQPTGELHVGFDLRPGAQTD
jgi:hypothetical protein